MDTEYEVEEVCEELQEYVGNIVDNIERFSQQDSMEIYAYLSAVFRDRAAMIRREMG